MSEAPLYHLPHGVNRRFPTGLEGPEGHTRTTPLFFFFFFFTLVTGPRRSLSLKLSDTRVYEPRIRARLGTTAHFWGGEEAGGNVQENALNHAYRGTSLIRKRLTLGPYSRPMPRVLGES